MPAGAPGSGAKVGKKSTPPEGGLSVRARAAQRVEALRPKLEAAKKLAVKERGLKATFTPMNLEAFVTTFSGALAGMTAGNRSLTNSDADYVSQTVAALLWAQEFDLAWNDASPINENQAELMLLLSMGQWNGVSPYNLNDVAVAKPVLNTISVILAAFDLLRAESVTPGTWGGGAG